MNSVRFQQIFTTLNQAEKDNITQTVLLLSKQFQFITIAELMKESIYQAKEAMKPFKLKKQRIHHATIFAAIRYAIEQKNLLISSQAA